MTSMFGASKVPIASIETNYSPIQENLVPCGESASNLKKFSNKNARRLVC